MFVLTSKIEIGEYTFRSIHEVEITKSVEDLVGTAVVKLPAKFKIRQSGKEVFTEEAIKSGDKVQISLGYKDRYEGVEFIGFVASVGSKIPLEIKCEDKLWQLRRKNITKAFNSGTTLKEILREVVSGTDIELSDKIPDMPIEKYIIKNANGTQVLQKLKEDFSLSIYLDFENKLYAGLQQLSEKEKRVIYDLNYNLVENNLEYKTEEEKRLKIRYTYIDEKNKKQSVEVGDEDGELRTFHTTVVKDKAKLKEMALAELKNNKYSGFDGSVTSFLIPYVAPGYTAELRDAKHKNREGKYFVKKVVTRFSRNGARREASISNKL